MSRNENARSQFGVSLFGRTIESIVSRCVSFLFARLFSPNSSSSKRFDSSKEKITKKNRTENGKFEENSFFLFSNFFNQKTIRIETERLEADARRRRQIEEEEQRRQHELDEKRRREALRRQQRDDRKFFGSIFRSTQKKNISIDVFSS